MKEIIKKLLRENLLSERLTEIENDVNMLYDKFFSDDIKKLRMTGMITDDMFGQYVVDTSIFTDEESKKAHELNSCKLYVNYGSNYYKPQTYVIHVSVSKNAIIYVVDDHGGDLKSAVSGLNIQSHKNSLVQDFSEERIKGSIHHELTHWIDDTLHNRHLSKTLDKAMERGTKDFKGIPFDSTYIEVQGQIHNVKQLYNKYKDRWDELTFTEMINLSPPLYSLFNRFNAYVRQEWVLKLKKRMAREGILGKNMY